VHVRAGLARGSHDFLGAIDQRLRHQFDQVPSVREGGHTSPGGQRRHG
jgi:hypothetical protein